MSFAPKAVSGNSTPTIPQVANPAPKKEDPKREITSQLVTNTLLQSALAQPFHPLIEASPAKKLEIATDAMNLKVVKTTSDVSAPAIKLGLAKEEKGLIDDMFTRWALYDRICLLELWNLDLYADLQTLEKYLPKEEMSAILDKFCACFASGQVSMCGERAPENAPVKLQFAEKGVKTENASFVRSRRYWVAELDQIKESLGKLASSKMRMQTVSDALKVVKKKIDLGKQLLLHPHAMTLLIDYNLSGHELNFPRASALNSDSPEKTLKDLISYAKFIDRSFISATKLGYLGIKVELLHNFTKMLSILSANGKLFANVKHIKQRIGPSFLAMKDMFTHFKEAIPAAAAGTLDQVEYYQKVHGTSITSKKNPTEFASQLIVSLLGIGSAFQFFYDILEILDERVMEPLYPDLFVPTIACFARLGLNMGAFFDATLKQIGARSAGRTTPLPPPSLIQKDSLKDFENQTDLFKVFIIQTLTLPIPEYMVKWETLQETSSGRFHLHTWIPFVKELEPLQKVADSLVDELNDRRQTLLLKIEAFLKTLDPALLAANREQLTHYFEELCFQGSLELCRLIMISQDMKAVSQLHVNLAVVNSEEHLLPQALVDFMALEGVEELFNKLLFPDSRPMAEDLRRPPAVRMRQARVSTVAQTILVPAKKTVVERVETKKEVGKETPAPATPQRSSLSLTDAPLQEPAPVSFSIRRGEKTRKILARLREMGFLPTTKRGSHQKLENKEGQTVIVPTDGKRKHQKPGTAQSIASQVNKKS